MSDRNHPTARLAARLARQMEPVPFSRGLGRRFGNLKVRPKLILLHNIFFLTLACGVYFAVIPAFENRVAQARDIEISLIRQIFAADRAGSGIPELEEYQLNEDVPTRLGIDSALQARLDANPGEVIARNDVLFRKNPKTGLYSRLVLPTTVYDEVVDRTRTTLFVVLGMLYILAVLLLELVIMPRYVYGPIRLMLEADKATRQGDRERELIDPAYVTEDEIGRIMQSRNETVQELRRQEDDLARAIAHLEAQDRLASLGLLSASVAHEMNTPLTVLHGSVEQLLETAREPALRQRLERMRRVTERLRTISAGLLDFARVRRDQMEPVALRPVIEEAWSLVSIDDKASEVSFENHVPESARVIGNGDRLVQVFVNLLRNALEAVAPGGHVWARCRRPDRNSRRRLCVVVEDDGPGIPDDVLPNIFEAFVSSRLDSRGTGLGLTVAAGIVQQHEGEIHASNRPGGGARLEVVLPAAE